MAGGPISPYSAVPITAANTFPYIYVGVGSNSKHDQGLGVAASIGSNSIWRLRFMLPPAIPTGTFKLLVVALSAANAGAAQVQPSWCIMGTGMTPGDPVLLNENISTITWVGTGQNLSSATVSAGGSNYVAGDFLTLSGGISTTAAQVKILTVSGTAALTVGVADPGNYTSLPTNPITTSAITGIGSGATLNGSWTGSGDFDKYKFTKISLTAQQAPTSSNVDQIIVMDINFLTSSWSLAAISLWNFFLLWE